MTLTFRKYTLLPALTCLIVLAGTACQAMDSSVKELIGQLNSPDAIARLAAIDQLGDQGANAVGAVGPLTSLLKDDDPAVRSQAVKALVAIHPGPKVMIPSSSSL